MSFCTGWRIENLRVGSGQAELVLQYGPFFRLNVFVGTAPGMDAPQAQGFIEFAQSGELFPLLRAITPVGTGATPFVCLSLYQWLE